jgi:hypothetical protein
MGKCRQIEEMIIKGDIEVDLSYEDYNVDLSGHIAVCPDCRSLASDLKAVSEKLKSMPKINVSSEFEERLWSRIRSESNAETHVQAEKHVPFFSKVFYYASGVAAIVVAFVYVTSLGVFDTNNTDKSQKFSPQGFGVISEADVRTDSSVTDSLENLGKNVVDDEKLRLRVSTGE